MQMFRLALVVALSSAFLVLAPGVAGAVTTPDHSAFAFDAPAGTLEREARSILELETELAELQEAGAPDLLRRELRPAFEFASTATTDGEETSADPSKEASKSAEGAGAKSGTSEAERTAASESAAPAGLRLLAETGGGILLAGLGIVGGALAGIVTATLIAVILLPTGPFAVLVFLALAYILTAGGAAVGGAVMAPFGVWKAGDMTGGNGKILWTYVAGLTAAIASLFAIRPVTNLVGDSVSYEGRFAIGASIPIVSSLIGGILGYELSQLGADDSGTSADRGARIAPAFSLVGRSGKPRRIDGATLGVQLRF